MKTGGRSLVVLFALGSMALAGCAGKIVVVKVPESVAEGGRLPLDGVVYALPRTVVKVAVPVDRTEWKEGLYAEYAGLFFPDVSIGKDIADASSGGRIGFSIGKPVISTFGEPDPSKLYYVNLTGGGLFVDRTATLDYTEQGTVSGTQGSADNMTTDIVLGGIGALSGFAARGIWYGGGAKGEPDLKAIPGGVPPEDNVVNGFLKVAPEVFLNYRRLDDKMRGSVRKKVKDGDPRLAGALQAYKDIRSLNTARLDLITGGGDRALAALPSLELMLKEIDAQIARRMAEFFTGRKTKETWTPVFELRPSVAGAPPVELFTLDEVAGVCLKQLLHAQDDPPDGFAPTEACRSTDAKTIRVRLALDGMENELLFKRVQSVFAEGGERSFRYLIPAPTLATLEMVDPKKGPGGSASAVKGGKAVIMVGQFGAEVSLPASSNGRSLNYALKYFEATGALKSFSLASKTAMQGAVVDSLGKSANAVLDAKKQREKEESEKADELNRLERQRKILEEKAKIQELCGNPGMNCRE